MPQQDSARERICKAMLDLMEERPFEEIPVTEIARQAGVSRTIFYRYFDSVYDVLQELELDYIDGFPSEDSISSDLRSNLIRGQSDGPYMLTRYSCYIADNIRLYRILTSKNGEPSFKPRMHNRIYRIVMGIVGPQLGSNRPETDLIVEYITSAQIGAMDWWAAHDDGVDSESISAFISSMNNNTMKALIETDQRLGIEIRRRDD